MSVAELRPGEGILREALTSLYSLFGTTRDILRKYRPDIARGKGKGNLSFGYIAVAVLNGALRPRHLAPRYLLHPSRSDRTVLRSQTMRLHGNEPIELRDELNRVRAVLLEYAYPFRGCRGTSIDACRSGHHPIGTRTSIHPGIR